MGRGRKSSVGAPVADVKDIVYASGHKDSLDNPLPIYVGLASSLSD